MSSHVSCKCLTCKAAEKHIRATFKTPDEKRNELARIAIEQDLGFKALTSLVQYWFFGFADVIKAFVTTQNLYVAVNGIISEHFSKKRAA